MVKTEAVLKPFREPSLSYPETGEVAPKRMIKALDGAGTEYTGTRTFEIRFCPQRCGVDRLKGLVLVSGFNVYPNEIENVLFAHPDVVECAVIGVPDDKTGELSRFS